MKIKAINLLLIIIFFTGCTAVIENIPGFAHTASLMLGAPKQRVILEVQHVLGKPVEAFYDSTGEIHVRRYKFMKDQDIALYFNKFSFVQLVLVDANDELTLRVSRDQIEKLGGFVISKTKSGPGKLSYIRRKGQSAVPPIHQGSF